MGAVIKNTASIVMCLGLLLTCILVKISVHMYSFP